MTTVEMTTSEAAISRRGFLKAATLSGLGAAGAAVTLSTTSVALAAPGEENETVSETTEPTFMVAPEPIAEDDIVETIDTDVLIIGGGIAGSATAASCAEQGLKTFIVEKLEAPRAIGCDYGLVNPSIMEEKGIEPVDVYDAYRDHMEKSCHMCRADKAYRFMTASGEAGDWWIEKAKGYGYFPQVIAMKSESDHFKNYTHVVELWDQEDELSDFYGPIKGMMEYIKQEVVDAGGEYRNNTEAVQLLTSENGDVIGAVCATEDGYIQVNATKGVVLAAGDYAGNKEMLNYYTNWDYDKYDPASFMAQSMGAGDGHRMGMWAGAYMQEAPHPLMLFLSYVYSYLRVNKLGQRYVNEDSGYTGGCNAQLLQPEGVSWAVWDSKWSEELPAQLPYAGGMSWDQDARRIEDEWTPEREEVVAFSWERESGDLVEADTLEELAVAMGLDEEATKTFLATVEKYNQGAREGDSEFGKRSELMTEIVQAPFYALKMNVALAVSVGGLVTNADSECLNEAGKPIPGLYAVGNNAGGLFGVDYNEVTVPGISLGRSVTFGYLLGKHLAEK